MKSKLKQRNKTKSVISKLWIAILVLIMLIVSLFLFSEKVHKIAIVDNVKNALSEQIERMQNEQKSELDENVKNEKINSISELEAQTEDIQINAKSDSEINYLLEYLGVQRWDNGWVDVATDPDTNETEEIEPGTRLKVQRRLTNTNSSITFSNISIDIKASYELDLDQNSIQAKLIPSDKNLGMPEVNYVQNRSTTMIFKDITLAPQETFEVTYEYVVNEYQITSWDETLKYNIGETIIPKTISGITKERLTTIPDGIDVVGINTDDLVILPADGSSVTLLYKLTVTGEEGADYKITDDGATPVSGDLTGTIPASGEAIVYVTKSFTKDDLVNGYLKNEASVEGINGTQTPYDISDIAETPGEVTSLSLIKYPERKEYVEGSDVSWNITVTNNSDNIISGLSLVDELMLDGIQISDIYIDGPLISIDNFNYYDPNDFSLKSGQSLTFKVTLEEASAGTYNNKAYLKLNNVVLAEGESEPVEV